MSLHRCPSSHTGQGMSLTGSSTSCITPKNLLEKPAIQQQLGTQEIRSTLKSQLTINYQSTAPRLHVEVDQLIHVVVNYTKEERTMSAAKVRRQQLDKNKM